MTVDQLQKYALSKISIALSFDKDNVPPVKFLHLGQLRTEHFFLFSFTSKGSNCIADADIIKKAVKVLDELGFKDPQWVHNVNNKENQYSYYCYIEKDAMLKIK